MPCPDGVPGYTGSMNSAAPAHAQSWRSIYLHAGTIPYWGVHVGAVVGLAYVGWSWTGVALAAAVYVMKMFFVTGAYHRYFSHRSFKTSRWFQFVLGVGASTTLQKGILWWAAHHRHHHKTSDQHDDLHSPYHGGFWWSHHGWILGPTNDATDLSKIKDMAKYPELRWLNTYWYVPAIAFAVGCYVLGGLHALVWGFAVAQVLNWHLTFTINSLSHVWGSKRYASGDDSRNNPLLGLLTLGEGWHNNHHHYQRSARQGFFWWEIDITYYVLRGLAAVGLVWDVHGVPDHIRDTTLASMSGASASEPMGLGAVEREAA
jgi:stearoyl-CoA desaturase (delta-9 desaturase)